MLPLILYCSLLYTLLGASTATDWPHPILTTNTSRVQRGQPFTAQCQMLNFAAPSEAYYLRFWRNTSAILFRYDFPAASSGGTRQPSLYNGSDRSVTVRSLVFNLTMAEIEITSLISGAFYFECDNPGSFSNKVNVKVVERLPTVTFTLNTSSLTVNRPFTATCAISNFETTTSNYTVDFYSKRDGRLATYETVHGTSVLLIEKHLTLFAHHGPRTSFPAFDLKLVENQDVREAEYWCKLEVPNLGTVSSSHWIQEPVVRFTSSAPNSTTRLGTCSVDNFEPTGREYSVAFWTDLGPRSVNRLATYAVKPNEIIEFLVEEVSGWTHVQTGGDVTFPKFTLIAENSPFIGTWWCVLGLGVEGSAGYREIKSSAVNLA